MKSRRLLQVCVSIMGLTVVGAVIVVFARSLSPALDKEPPFLEISINEITPGSYRVVNWRGKPFVVVRTSEEMNQDLKLLTEKTWNHRPLLGSEQFFVFSKISTFRGCSLWHAPKRTHITGEEQWLGGFYDPCHFGDWDYAGRSIKRSVNQPDSMKLPDLAIPKYEIVSGSVIRLL